MYSSILENKKKWQAEYQSLGTSSTTSQCWWNVPTTVDCTDAKEERIIHKEKDTELCELPQDLEEQLELEKAEVDKRLKEIEEARTVEEDRLKRIQQLSTGAFQSRVCRSARLLSMDFETFQSQIQCTRTPERERSRSADPLLAHAETYFSQNVETECVLEPTSGPLSATELEDFSMMVQTELDEECTPTLSTTSSKQQHETPTFQPNVQTKSTDRNTIHTKHKREPLTKPLEDDVRNVGDLVNPKQNHLSNKQTKTVGQSKDRSHSRLYSPNAPRYAV
ncbi:hypothetical protein P879_08820 [Paragonimus westermani]|uniref:Uncharacterized protein n=1 Tax=Paragonimus westermani TaxID=34504 RepID=A0A8T0DAP1_9TREM|nr:hypothetical protein P879_08820 [Paragonimus westermani]